MTIRRAMQKRRQMFFCFSVLLGMILSFMAGCKSSCFTAQTTPTLSIEERVLRTLVAFQTQPVPTQDYPYQDQMTGESHSIEITQVPVLDGDIADEFSQIDVSAEIPEEHYIWNIWGHRQFFPIGCEVAAAKDWAAFWGVEINEFNFQYQLPESDNPDLGFVGSVEGPWRQVPPYAYGVHCLPVAKVLREQYGLNAVGVKGFTLEELKAQIAADQPVIVWVIGNCVSGVPYEYIDKDGNTVTVAAYEHVVIVTGYNHDTIRYLNDGKFYDIPVKYFLNSWKVLGNMSVHLKP